MVIQTGFVRAHKACLAGLLAAAAAIVPSASADILGPGLSIYAWDNAGNFAQTAIEGAWDATHTTFTWSSDSTIELWDQGTDTLLGCVNPMDREGHPMVSAFQFLQDPVVNLNFAVQAGASASTTFMIASSLLTFPTLTNAQGAASAGFSVTDFNGNGATLSGLAGTGGAFGYLAQYNGFAGTQSGTTFSEAIPSVVAGGFGTNTGNSNVPGAGYQAIPGSISDMSAMVKFTLSRFDLASGTTSFVVIPEPSSMLLIGVGGLFAIRRRG